MRLVSVCVLMAGSVWAGQKTMVLTAGDCSDAALISGAKDFRDATRKLVGGDVVEPEVVLDIVRPRPTRSVQDLERQIDSAKTLFYGGQNERALELIERALVELERAEPDARPWKVTENALVLEALVFKNLDRTKDMNEAFRRIVRINPTVKLDPEAHAPSTIAALDVVKREVARAKKVTLSVRVESGPVGSVAIDGQVVGVTPLKIDLLPGTYRVSLMNGPALSFPHRVELPRDSKLSVDLAFEGAVSRQLPLCMAGVDDGAALKLAQLVSAERLVVLRNQAKVGAPPYISGALYDVPSSRQERTGAVAPELIGNLATFVVTGREQAGVRRPDTAPEPIAAAELKTFPSPAPVKDSEPPKEALVPSAPPPAPLLKSAPLPAPAPSPGFLSTGRVIGFVLIGLGVAASIGGGVSFGQPLVWTDTEPGSNALLIARPEERLAGIRAQNPIPGSSSKAGREAIAIDQHLHDMRALGISLIGGGVAAMITGVLAIIFFPPGAPTVSVAPTNGGASMSLSGSF